MFTKRNLILLFGKHTIIAIVAISIATLAVWFLSREIERVSDAVSKNRQLAEKLGKRTELFSAIANDARIIGTNDATIEHSFIPTDNILEFISILESTALKNSITQSFHFGTPVATSITAPFVISSIDYQNSMSLNIYSFIKYLKDFESLPYFTKINSLNFTSQDATGWRGAGSASWSATLYTKTNQ